VTLLQQKLGRHQLGIWLAIFTLGILCLAWIMQGYSLLDWEGAIELGIQNDSFNGDPAEQAWALESWGVAMADMLWPMPITILGLIGLLRNRTYGFVLSMMAFSIGVYFPLFFAFQRWEAFRGVVIAALLLFTLPCLIGILGLWANRRIFVD